MPFEPLKTDEKMDKPPAPEKSMDDLMLMGCTGFVVAALGTYFLSIWPFLAFQETYRLGTLALCLALALIPASALGVWASRKYELPGACGFIGGSMAITVFLHLRIQQVMVALNVRELPRPEYPPSWMWLVPGAWLLVSVILGLVMLPRTPDENR